MKKLRETIFIFLCAASLFGCSPAGAEAKASQAQGAEAVEAKISVVSLGECYYPAENFTYSQCLQRDENGVQHEVSACGRWLRPEDVKRMTRVPWDEEMRLEAAGQVLSFDCRLYDENYEELEKTAGEGGGNLKDIPAEAGSDALAAVALPSSENAYYVELSVTFGRTDGEDGYQYFFQVIPEDPSPLLSVSDSKEGGDIDLPWTKGGGTFPALLRGEALPYIPIGTRLYFSFSQGKSPASVRAYDLILDGASMEEEELQELELAMEDGVCSVYVGANLEAFRYRYAEAYKPGGIPRGLLLECDFEDGTSEQYALAFRTDAAFGIKEKSSSAYLMELCGTAVPILAECSPAGEGHGLTVTFEAENVSSRDFSYGSEVRLYRFDGPELKELSPLPGAAWEDVARTLKAGKRKKQRIDMASLFGPLGPGYYRLSKNFISQEDETVQTVSADFVINAEP